ncbi:uncharacterized protein KRP23_3770 [Phytophthora ramorum]|uniref:uncharacterized protein n=1 Tax=Phytophthora ramorum TaxID=164328 RepID=UPI0030AEFDF0|nr:hypothetical protein KRP23_3770 [Phytophthora ramorum]
MAASFPFVDPVARIDSVLWSVFHCREDKALAVLLTHLWEIWSLHPTLQHRVVASRSGLLKIVILRILCAIRLHSSPAFNLPLHQLHTLLQLLQSIASKSVLLQRFTKQLQTRGNVERVQQRFSEFTSGWKLCIELVEILSYSLVVSQEFVIDDLDLRAQPGQLGALPAADDGTFSVASGITTHSVASSKYSVAKSVAGFEVKQAHYQSAIAKDVIQEDGSNTTNEKFKLKTLEEHRYATRFQEKQVTPKTWRSALREAHKLILSEDRGNVTNALYLLLEIIWLDPPGSNLATLYLDAGSIYLAFDHLDEAAKAYRNSLRLDSSSWKAHFNLGVALARLEDFVDATRQFKLALASCPGDIAVEIGTMLEEISRIQSSRNLRAFSQTKKARMFTTQYLESLHQISGNSRNFVVANPLQEDHTLSHRNGLARSSATPQLLDVSQEWKGSLASLLHRVYAVASCRRLSVQDEMLRVDPTRTSGISVQCFGGVVERITGVSLRATERKELVRTLGSDGTIIFHFLAPNAESTSAFDEMQRLGACYSLLEWSLCRKRAKRSPTSKAGGLWYWFDITMEKWVEQVLPQIAPHDHVISSLGQMIYPCYSWPTAGYSFMNAIVRVYGSKTRHETLCKCLPGVF